MSPMGYLLPYPAVFQKTEPGVSTNGKEKQDARIPYDDLYRNAVQRYIQFIKLQ